MAKRFSNLKIPVGLPGSKPPPPVSKIIFDKYDKDHSGTISTSDLKFLCEDMGHLCSDSELEVAIKLLDTSGDGQLGYEEFKKWWSNESRFNNLQKSDAELASLQEAIQTFKHFDKDKGGKLDKPEFKALYDHLTSLGLKLKSVDEAFSEIDNDSSGHVSFNEFVDWSLKNGISNLKIE
jgi:Ca2+-binding EF-hand superfamily protein